MSATRIRSSACLVALAGALLLAGCRTSPKGNDLPLSPDSARSVGLGLSDRLSTIYRRSDWPALAAIIAPEYLGTAPNLVWNRDSLQVGFPKVHFVAFQRDDATVKELTPGLLLVNEDGLLTESFDGQDISGAYRMTDIWIRRDGRWLLLFEQEMRRAGP